MSSDLFFKSQMIVLGVMAVGNFVKLSMSFWNTFKFSNFVLQDCAACKYQDVLVESLSMKCVRLKQDYRKCFW